jgi:hypothetical protein
MQNLISFETRAPVHWNGLLVTWNLELNRSRKPKIEIFFSVKFVRSQPRFAIYSRLCSRSEEAFGEGTRARLADSSNEGGDALKTKCAFSREGKNVIF